MAGLRPGSFRISLTSSSWQPVIVSPSLHLSNCVFSWAQAPSSRPLSAQLFSLPHSSPRFSFMVLLGLPCRPLHTSAPLFRTLTSSERAYSCSLLEIFPSELTQHRSHRLSPLRGTGMFCSALHLQTRGDWGGTDGTHPSWLSPAARQMRTGFPSAE